MAMDKNTKTLLSVFVVVGCMIGLAFASVPLYDLFCRVTGFGGTTQRAEALPNTVVNREITIRFDANTSRDIPWNFKPEAKEQTVKLGQQGLISYIAENRAKEGTTGTAIYNVTPAKVGRYFHKIQCFCFAEQHLTPGQSMYMPVMYFVDPKMNDDRSMDDVTTITLSYTFFPASSEELDQALEDFYNSDTN